MRTVRSLVALGTVAGLLSSGVPAGPAVAAARRPSPLCEQPPEHGRCERWLARYSSPDGASRNQDVVVAPDGTSVYVTGSSVGPGSGSDYATIAYDAATGSQRWVARFGGAGAQTPAGIALSPDGATVYVTGSGDGGYLTVAYDASSGAPVWEARHVGPAGSATAKGVAVSHDGRRVYVGGYAPSGPAKPPSPAVDNFDYTTVAYDAGSGERLWVSTYDGPASFWDVAEGIDVAATPAGERVVVTGRSNGASAANGHADIATVAYDGESGAQQWVARYDGPAGDRDLAYALTTSADGRTVFVTGESFGAGTDFDYVTLAYDTSGGAQRWEARYDGARAVDRPLAVASAGGRVVVTGFSAERNDVTWVLDRAIATVAYDAATGEQQWDARRTWPGGAAASSVALSPDGTRVYAAGVRVGMVFGVGVNALGLAAAFSGFALVANDAATGAELWTGGYGGAGNEDSAQTVTVGPDGHVYVTGGGREGVTLSYSP